MNASIGVAGKGMFLMKFSKRGFSLKALQLSIIHDLEWLNVIFDSLVDDGVKRFLFVNISRFE